MRVFQIYGGAPGRQMMLRSLLSGAGFAENRRGIRRVQVGGDHAISRPAVAISEGQDGGEGCGPGLDAQLLQEASSLPHPQALFLRAPLHRCERAGFGATLVVEDALAVVERGLPPYVCFTPVDGLAVHGVHRV